MKTKNHVRKIILMKNDFVKEIMAISDEIGSLAGEWEPKLSALTEDTVSSRQNVQKRTIRQILGHLVDSASNNTHRVIHLQYQESPLIFPNYATFGNNDKWIAIQDYQDEDWMALIQLWKYSLLHYCHIIKNIDINKLDNEWISGPGERISLKTMITDFPKHLKLHLYEISCLAGDK